MTKVDRIDGYLTPAQACERASDGTQTVICIGINEDGSCAVWAGSKPGTNLSNTEAVGYLEWAKGFILGWLEPL